MEVRECLQGSHDCSHMAELMVLTKDLGNGRFPWTKSEERKQESRPRAD